MRRKRRWFLGLMCALVVTTLSSTLTLAAQESPPTGGTLVTQARALLEEAPLDATGKRFSLRKVIFQDGALSVCLDVPITVLAADGWMGVERVTEQVEWTLSSLPWHALSVLGWDPASGQCKPLSDFAPHKRTTAPITAVAPEIEAVSRATTVATAFPASLAGKTIYVSAGHGWFWNGKQWRTQRPVYQGIIEDHNNAEAVTQYLIPYLENAGATVIPVRERDWNHARVIADNDQGAPTYSETGAWQTGGSGPGYAGGTYRYAVATQGSPTAIARWTIAVPQTGTYAVYAWVYPGNNRVPDAHYTIQHAGGTAEVILDQRVMPETWRYLGTFPFYEGNTVITLDNHTSATDTRAVIADAIRIGGGIFDSLAGIPQLTSATTYASSTPPTSAPYKPWWETGTFYWSQWMGLDPDNWPYFNDVVARPMYARWYERTTHADAVYISWHTNGSRGTARGTVSYVHNGDTFPRTPGSTELQAAVHNKLIHDIRAGWDPTWTDRGMGKLNLGELRMLWDEEDPAARIPGALFEIAFHDNPEDAEALKDPRFNQLAARAIYQGIVHYFETRDGVDLVLAPEPPTHLRVENVANGSIRVSWAPSPVDSNGLGGEAATAYRVYTSPDGFAWSAPTLVHGTSTILSGFNTGDTVYVRVTGINAGGESFPTEVLGARIGEPDLLLVNGFDKINRFGMVEENDPVEGLNERMWLDQINSRNYVVHHGEAVPATMAWDSTSNEAVMDGDIDLAAYNIVDWILGEEATDEDGSLNAAERAKLTDYLHLGRSLLISGSEFGWDLVELGRDPAFLTTQLHTKYVADNANTHTAQPTAGSAFANLGAQHFDAVGEYTVDYPDVLAPGTDAQSALTYIGGTGGTAAVQYANGCQRLLVLGFPIETVRATERSGLMAAAMDYLNSCSIDTAILSPQDGETLSITPVFTGTASGDNLMRVELQLERHSDGAFWTGNAWGAAASWFVASGTNPWSYLLLAMAEDSYTLKARAVSDTATDEQPAQVSFILDRTAPLVPTVITPTGNSELMGPVISLVWTPPTDTGSPLRYDVAVDSRVLQAQGPPYQLGLGSGPHQWRVRAVDAAGNVGPWTSWHTFQVDVEEVFLPLVLREWEH